MKIAAWNLNNRVGTRRFRPEAADAAMALDADVLVLTEYYPQAHQATFEATLAAGGWNHQLLSPVTSEVANRVLVASGAPIVEDPYPRPSFDAQLPANVQIARLPGSLRLIAIRIPAYESHHRSELEQAWDWLTAAAAAMSAERALIIGDLNSGPEYPEARGRKHFRRMLESGWILATPLDEQSYFNARGIPTSTPDHALVTPACRVLNARFVRVAGGLELAGSVASISDHAALLVEVA